MEKIKYTDDVLNFIIPRYKAGKWDEIFEKFPNVKKQSLYAKMSRLGIKRDDFYWTEEEIDILKNNYNYDCDVHELSKLLPNKSYDSITTKARKLGLKTRERAVELINKQFGLNITVRATVHELESVAFKDENNTVEEVA